MSGVRSANGVLLAGGYVVLSVADMALSSVAFALGIPEANPVFTWAAAHGLFEALKLALTALAGLLLVWFYPRHYFGKLLAWAAVASMTGVIAYHVWGLHAARLLRMLCALPAE